MYQTSWNNEDSSLSSIESDTPGFWAFVHLTLSSYLFLIIESDRVPKPND